MKYFIFLLSILGSISFSHAQSICSGTVPFKILHFTGTSGFDHNTRSASATMFTEIGQIENFTIVDTDDSDIFNNLDSMMTFAAIVFSNTSGNSLFDALQRQNLESYFNSGKGFLGLHAATDTYRTGWPYYNSLVGGIVQTSPNHTSQNHVDTMTKQLNHPVVYGLPDPWIKQEEYYYWDLNGGMVDTINFTTAYKVNRTGSQSYDRERPITWFRKFPSGTRSFYTALGHKSSNYTDPSNEFRHLVRNGVCWVSKASATEDDPDIWLDVEYDISVADKNHGLIMKSADGSCWKITVETNGQLKSSPITCPE